ncbi:MAG: nicotinamide-nucleotide amidohydrolase family protein [Thermovirgaceae bacterium]
MAHEAVLIAVGDELLSGSGREGNCAWLASQLTSLGWRILSVQIVPDNEDVLVNIVRSWIGKAEVIVLSGGLGPTHDDRTREALSRLLGSPLARRDDVYGSVLSRYHGDIRRILEESANKQAMVPASAEALHNPQGSALAIRVETDGTEIYAFPGVPWEFQALAEKELLPRLVASGRIQRVIRVAGWPESRLKIRIGPVLEDDSLSISILPSPNCVTVSIFGFPEAVEEATEKIRALVPGDILPVGAASLAEAVYLEASRVKTKIALAESCSGGLIGAALTEITGVSSVFTGSAVCYDNEAKISLLGVPRDVLDEYGAVSEECAAAMAEGAARIFGTPFSLSVTGIAGPGGATPGKPVGTVCFAVVSLSGLSTWTKRFHGDRTSVRRWAVAFGLEKLWRELGRT